MQTLHMNRLINTIVNYMKSIKILKPNKMCSCTIDTHALKRNALSTVVTTIHERENSKPLTDKLSEKDPFVTCMSHDLSPLIFCRFRPQWWASSQRWQPCVQGRFLEEALNWTRQLSFVPAASPLPSQLPSLQVSNRSFTSSSTQ